MERRAKKKARKRNTFNTDRLSELPDAIIHEIFSFLDIKQVIQTCVLSKRWERTWASLPNLSFDRKYGNGYDSSEEFENFVLKFLSRRDDECNVVKFELDNTGWFDVGESLSNRIISYVDSHNVQYLHLRHEHYHSLPLVLENNSIKTLILDYFMVKFYGFGFAKLTLLNLRHCSFLRDSEDPFANCPSLKSLTLQQCTYSYLKVFKISGPQLANLEIRGGLWYPGIPPLTIVDIVAPKLTSFTCKVDTQYFSMISGLNLPTLDRVELSLNVVWSDAMWNSSSELGMKLTNMLQDLHNAEYVELSRETIKLLNLAPGLLEQRPCPFKRLKSLKVTGEIVISSSIPSHVKTYLLGSDPYEETRHLQGLYAREVVFQKVEKKLLPILSDVTSALNCALKNFQDQAFSICTSLNLG